ncbi:MAG TPA: manganese catalase family protein [Capillimicrobium sp.]
MFEYIKSLQYTVRVDNPNPAFAKYLQQAIGGVEGEMRVMNQYFFQAMNMRPPASKYKDMVINTATEEIGHIEMLCTAVALNLEGGAAETESPHNNAMHPLAHIKLAGQDPRQYLSAGLGAMPADANGVPFDASHVYASGNLVADMHSNIAAEATGRLVATRLWHMTDDPGMKDMLAFLIARDTMHQNQWLAVLEEVADPYPVPSSFPQSEENQRFNYSFLEFSDDAKVDPASRFATGPSIDGKGEFRLERAEATGGEPKLGPAMPETGNIVEAEPGRFTRSVNAPAGD